MEVTETTSSVQATAFFSSAEAPLQRELNDREVEEEAEQDLSSTALVERFELEETASWIACNEFKRVALQFPDRLLPHAAPISRWLEERTCHKPVILADCTYGSCCVDEIGAEHASADCLVHFGETCGSTVTPSSACKTEVASKTSLPVRFVFDRAPFATNEFAAHLKEVFDSVLGSKAEIAGTVVELLYDAAFAHIHDQLSDSVAKQCADRTAKVIVHRLWLGATADASSIDADNTNTTLGRKACPSSTSSSSSKTSALIYVSRSGSDTSALLPLWLLTHPNISRAVCFDARRGLFEEAKSVDTIRRLKRRLYLVERIRDARTIGLVCCAVGVPGHREILARLKQLCSIRGKKCYTFSVGKPNVAKLSNFAAEIDAFVMISCPFGVLLDTSEYYRPVVTAFEAEVALNADLNWNADDGWTPEFAALLSRALPAPRIDDETADVSLITGKVRCDDRQLTEEGDLQLQVYSAADHFGERTWKGLEEGISDPLSTAEKATEGRSGIASGYRNEQASS